MIMYCNKLDQMFKIFISKFTHSLFVSEIIWKCYRCSLTFKDKDLADMHRQVSNHSVTKVKVLVA